jgi:hypothetical protein
VDFIDDITANENESEKGFGQTKSCSKCSASLFKIVQWEKGTGTFKIRFQPAPATTAALQATGRWINPVPPKQFSDYLSARILSRPVPELASSSWSIQRWGTPPFV